VLFVPREISWNEESISLKSVLPGGGTFRWEELEAYSDDWGFHAILLFWYIKFYGQQVTLILPLGYEASEWRQFHAALRTKCPEKRTWMWVLDWPIGSSKITVFFAGGMVGRI